MPTNEWVTLVELFDRLEAEILKEAIEALGIPVQLFQEGVSHYLYPVSGPMGKIELCVPGERFQEALSWFEAYSRGEFIDNNNDETDNLELD